MGGAVIVTMNNKRFDKLPQEVQQIIIEVANEYETQAAQALDQRQMRGLEDLRNSGANVVELGADSRIIWARSLTDFPNAMAEEANSRGMPGTKVMNTYIDTVTQSGHSWPTEYEIK